MKYDIIILGAGHAGLTMAAVLGAYDINVCLVDRIKIKNADRPWKDLRTTALSYGTKNLFERFGLWEELAPHACPIEDIRVADKNSFYFVHFDHADKAKGPMGWIAENHYISKALFAKVLNAPSVTIKDEAEILEIETSAEEASLSLKSGEVIRADLLVAADGRNSLGRKMMGLKSQFYDYKQKAIVCTISHTKPHHNYAIEHFYPAGPFALLPMTDNRMSVVWCEPTSVVDEYMQLDEDKIMGHLAQKIEMDLGEITVETGFQSFPLSLSFAEEYIADSFALIGDAAHGIHPLAGQGFNLGVRDVAVLAEKIIEAKQLGLSLGSDHVLKAYQQCRRFDNGMMSFAMDFLNRLFGTQNKAIRHFRNIGFWGVERLPVAKNFFMGEAMGDIGNTPLFLQSKIA